MINEEMLKILVCPQNQTPLELADGNLLGRLNRAIRTGRVVNQGGQPVREPLGGGLIRQDKRLLYPIIDDIPVLLADKAVSVDQLDQFDQS
ncbi:MAG: hypothetical protein JXB62_18420 [Pirellulales bacterium]|nr:hypothetical protein [Pirellulales bacterium]